MTTPRLIAIQGIGFTPIVEAVQGFLSSLVAKKPVDEGGGTWPFGLLKKLKERETAKMTADQLAAFREYARAWQESVADAPAKLLGPTVVAGLDVYPASWGAEFIRSARPDDVAAVLPAGAVSGPRESAAKPQPAEAIIADGDMEAVMMILLELA